MSDEESKFIPPEVKDSSEPKSGEVVIDKENKNEGEKSLNEPAKLDAPLAEKKESKELIERMEKWCEKIVRDIKAGEVECSWSGKPRLGDGKWQKDKNGQHVGSVSDYESGRYSKTIKHKGGPQGGALLGHSLGYSYRGLGSMAALTMFAEQYLFKRQEERFRKKMIKKELPRTFFQKISGMEPKIERLEVDEPYLETVDHYELKRDEKGNLSCGLSFFYVMDSDTGNDGRLGSTNVVLRGLTEERGVEIANILLKSPDLFFDVIKRVTDLGEEIRSGYTSGASNVLEWSPPMQYADDAAYQRKDDALTINILPLPDGDKSCFDYLQNGSKSIQHFKVPLTRRHLLEEK